MLERPDEVDHLGQEEPEFDPTASTPAASSSVGSERQPMAVLEGLAVVLISLWGAGVAYAGPTFHFGPADAAAWQWTTPHAVLNLLPGLGGMAAGLMMTLSRRGGGLVLNRAAGLTALASGAWFILGRAIYPIFYGAAAPSYTAASHSPLANFATVLGYGLGVGILLAAFGGVFLGMRPYGSEYRPAYATGAVPVRRRRLRNTDPAHI